MLLNYLDSSPVNVEDIAEATLQHPILSKVMRFTESGWSKEGQQRDHFEPYRKRQAELSVEQDCFLLGQRVIEPTRLREKILENLHAGHQGIARTKALAHSFVW